MALSVVTSRDVDERTGLLCQPVDHVDIASGPVKLVTVNDQGLAR
jgi:hypothetical protein